MKYTSDNFNKTPVFFAFSCKLSPYKRRASSYDRA